MMPTKIKLIIAGTILFFILIIILFLNKSRTPTDAGNVYDANSGETISNPANRQAESVGRNSDEPIYLGISKLIDRGLTQDQVTDLKTAFYTFAKQTKPKIKIVSITVASIHNGPIDHSGSAQISTYFFDIVLDQKTKYHARFDCYDLSSAKLTITSSASQTIFDSGTLSPYSAD